MGEHSTFIVKLGGDILGLSQIAPYKTKDTLVHGQNPTEGGCLVDLRPVHKLGYRRLSFSLALSSCHVTCQKQMKIERIQLKIELNSISQPNSEGASGNTVQYS